jgi:hypothetical protein
VNRRMINHLNKSINLNKGRIRIAKRRYIELNTEVNRMKRKMNEDVSKTVSSSKKKKNRLDEGSSSSSSSSSSSEDGEDEDDNDYDIDKQCSVELHFDCTSSSTTSGGSGSNITETNGIMDSEESNMGTEAREQEE